MKKVIGVLATDLHLHKDNIEQKKDICKQVEAVALKHKCYSVFWLGDMFESRDAQPQDVLNGFGDILEDKGREVHWHCIPGNHDKVNYESERSYLDQFKHHPNFELYTNNYTLPLNKEVVLHFIPYFKEETTYKKYLKKAVEKAKLTPEHKHILLTHVGINGVFTNDKELVEGMIQPEDFEVFFKVFIGHFHDQSILKKFIHYIGAVDQKNFGEDVHKGCTLLYSDGSHEFVKLKFQEYHKIEINIDKATKKEIDVLFNRHKNSKDHIRFEFSGSTSRLRALDDNKFKKAGIDVKKKRPEIEEAVQVSQTGTFTSLDKKEINNEFKEFCEVKKDEILDKKYGKDILTKQLN